MRRKIARVVALTLMLLVLVPAAPAGAVVGISATFCVSETHYLL